LTKNAAARARAVVPRVPVSSQKAMRRAIEGSAGAGMGGRQSIAEAGRWGHGMDCGMGAS
jgi:hypothetical protein